MEMNNKNKLVELVNELQYAKEAVIFCLNNESGSVDFHGLSYWAERVEKLRVSIKELI